MKADDIKECMIYTDTGGTFTDTFILDQAGNFFTAKAPSVPQDVAQGYYASVSKAAERCGLFPEELFKRAVLIAAYGGTVVLNTLVTRQGKKVGAIVTRGFEDILLMERGSQTYTEYSWQDRIHPLTHRHLEPLVPRKWMKGATEKIDCFGVELIPLYEDEVREAARELLKEGVEAIVICFIWSFTHESHERRARAIVEEVMAQEGKRVDVHLSVDINPVGKELCRLNVALIEAYAGPFSRDAILKIDQKLVEWGYKGNLQLMLSHGGLAPAKYSKMVETLESGPVGGLIGGKFIGDLYGFENIITTDVGGTSFDVGIITKGNFHINREPVCARFLLNIPIAEVTSIGAGGGTMASIDPLTNRLKVGPESAGAHPGPVCYELGGEVPTVTDADLILGYINPDYFLGGSIKLNKKKAMEAMEEKIAKPLGIDVLSAAAGIRELIDTRMYNMINGFITSRGYEVSDYTLLSFGGAGPTHVADITRDLPFANILLFPYSAVFSAFGASAADFSHHYNKATNLIAPPDAPDDTKVEIGKKINSLWEDLEERAYRQMTEEGFVKEKISLQHLAMVRYGRQLDDLIVSSPIPRISSPEDFDALIAAFEDLYEKIYTKSAKYPQAGYEIRQVGLVTSVEKIKPHMKKESPGPPQPSQQAIKGKRQAYFVSSGKLAETTIFELDGLRAGNHIQGPAIIEHIDTTIVIPPQWRVSMDEYRTLWLKR